MSTDPSKQQRDQRHDRKRREQKPWRSWYNLPLWQNIRREQLECEPLCERHKKRGEVVEANVVHHVHKHNGDWSLFCQGPFESLCTPCHNAEAQQEEAVGHSLEVGTDGWPIDPRHKANAGVRPRR